MFLIQLRKLNKNVIKGGTSHRWWTKLW